MAFDLGLFVSGDLPGELTRKQLDEGWSRGLAAAELTRQANRMYEADQTESAAKVFRQALSAYPRYAPALLGLANTLLRSGQYEDAARALAMATQVDSRSSLDTADKDTPGNLYVSGLASMMRGNDVAAEGLLRRVLVIDPGFWRAHISLARLLHRQGRSAEAEQHLQKAQQINPRALAPRP